MHHQVIRRRAPILFSCGCTTFIWSKDATVSFEVFVMERLDKMQLTIQIISRGQKEKNYILFNYHPTVTVDGTSSLCAAPSLLYAVL